MQSIADLRDIFFGSDDVFDDDTAAAGNGGTAVANANGGAISVGTINTGFNSGNAIAVGDTSAGGGGDDDEEYGLLNYCGED